jgi:pantoate kinase
MSNANPQHNSVPLTEARLEELLVDQTRVILNAVDQKLATQNVEILSAVDKRLEKLEERWLEKFNKLTTTLDKFLKRMTDMEEEFTFMKNDVNRIKAVLREKLGVSID